jgi:murein L,D-transpeptidase YafK
MRFIWASLVSTLLILSVYYFYPQNKLPVNTRVDKMILYKSKRELHVFANGELLKTYKVSLGRQPRGDKQYEGDGRTPEGLYYINSKNPNSAYHKNLGISYPHAADLQAAKKIRKSPGGDIKIHGLRNGMGFIAKFHRWSDWTLGCIAITDAECDELYSAVPIGTPIQINP